MTRTLIAFFCSTLLFAGAAVAELSPEEQRMADWIDAHAEDAIALLEETVNISSGTMNREGVREVGKVMRRELDALGLDTEWIEMPEEMNRAGHLFGRKDGEGKKILLIGHLDTVFEADDDFQAFVRDGDQATDRGSEEAGPPATPKEQRAVRRLQVMREEISRIEQIVSSFLQYVRLQGIEGRPFDIDALLGRLQNGDQCARPIATPCDQLAHRADPGRHMRIMATGMHDMRFNAFIGGRDHGACKFKAGLLFDRQAIHVGAQQQGGPRAIFHHGHHAMAANAGRHLEPQLLGNRGEMRGRIIFLE